MKFSQIILLVLIAVMVNEFLGVCPMTQDKGWAMLASCQNVWNHICILPRY